MPRSLLWSAAFTLLLTGCAGAQKHAEAADPAETAESTPAPELTSAKTDRPIQSEGAKTEATTSTTPPPAAAAPAPGGASGGDAALEAAVVRGDALPPPPPTTKASAKPHKAKKGSKAKKGPKPT
jgi:hypothetical protein